jgi:hypothetical protein
MSDVRSFLVPSGPRGFSKRRGRPGREPSESRPAWRAAVFRAGSDVVVTDAFRLLNATEPRSWSAARSPARFLLLVGRGGDRAGELGMSAEQ